MAKKKFTTRFEDEMIQRLKMQALRERTDPGKILERLLAQYLDEAEQS